MPYRKPSAWGLQKPPQGVRIDRGDPLAAGLVHDWLLNDNAAQGPAGINFRDYAGSANGSFGVGSPSTLTGNFWRSSFRGPALWFDNTGTSTTLSTDCKVGNSSGSGSPGASVFSIFGRIYPASTAAGACILGNGSANELLFRFNAGGALALVKPGVVQIGTSTGTLTALKWADIGITYDGTVAAFYLNGMPSGTASNAQTFALAAQYYLGSEPAGPERLPNGSAIGWLRVWRNRVLTPTDALRLKNAPHSIYVPSRRRIISQVASSGVTGTIAATDVRDTSSASGLVKVTGTVAATDVRDTSSAAGTVKVTGSVASTDVRDTSSAAGLVKVTGAVAASDVRDTSIAAGLVKVTGTAASTDRRDTSSAAGSVGGVIGTGAASDRRDTSAASGVLTVTGSVAATDRRDASSGAGTVEVVDSGSFFEADLFSHLMADATVSTLTDAERITPVVQPQGRVDYPAATYQVITLGELPNLSGHAGDVEHYRLQVDCWARTDAQASALADAVRARMRTAATNFRAVMLPSAFEEFELETRLFRVMLEFSVWYDVP